jgi:hypothetical protein
MVRTVGDWRGLGLGAWGAVEAFDQDAPAGRLLARRIAGTAAALSSAAPRVAWRRQGERQAVCQACGVAAVRTCRSSTRWRR